MNKDVYKMNKYVFFLDLIKDFIWGCTCPIVTSLTFKRRLSCSISGFNLMTTIAVISAIRFVTEPALGKHKPTFKTQNITTTSCFLNLSIWSKAH